MISPVYYLDEKYEFDIERRTDRGLLAQIHIADLHFGVLEPKLQYNILKEQCLDKIENMPILDLISIDGDLFHKKYMSNTDAVLYATKFISNLCRIAKKKNSTVILIYGTNEHDADQLKLFYHYLEDPEIDFRIVETIKFEYVKGAKILCIPEMYGVDEKIYTQYLHYSGIYDMCFMHGTIKGAIYNDNVGQGRLFTINDFTNCMGPIVSGHVHTGGCFERYFYYTGSPIRWQFGEENPKGFIIMLYDMNIRQHYAHLMQIESFRYDTINLDELIVADPKDIITHINTIKEEKGIDYIRIEFKKEIPTENLEILKSYYRNNGNVKFKISDSKSRLEKDKLDEEQLELYEQYDYLFDNTMNEYDKLAKYINDCEGYIYISGDQIKKLIMEED